MRTAIQLYTLRNVDESILSIIDHVGETSFEGVEFATRVDEAAPEDVLAHLDDAGLDVASAHVGIEDLEEDFDAVVETAHTLGYDDVVVPWLEPEHFESVAAVEAAAERLSTIAADLADEGLTLHYHNHDQEFQETEEGLAIEVLADRAPDVNLQVDAGWVLAGGVDPAAFIRDHADQITLVHMKDVALPDEVAHSLGEGDLDLEAVVEAAGDVDAEWLIFENDEPRDPLGELEHASEVFSRLV